MTKRNREYSEDFKEEAVNLAVKNNAKFRATGKRLGIPETTLRQWYNERVKKPQNIVPIKETVEDKAARLERENRDLKKEIHGLQEDRASGLRLTYERLI